jgi:hypothetical protein
MTVTGDRGGFMADLEQVSVLLPSDFVAWLRAEAKRIERPVSFVCRKLLLREQLNRSVDATDSVDDVVCKVPAA